MNERRNARLFLLSVIVPLVALWLVLRFVFDVPIAIITVVVTVLAVAAVVIWNRRARRSQAPRQDTIA